MAAEIAKLVQAQNPQARRHEGMANMINQNVNPYHTKTTDEMASLFGNQAQAQAPQGALRNL